jgi:hypothetical protein
MGIWLFRWPSGLIGWTHLLEMPVVDRTWPVTTVSPYLSFAYPHRRQLEHYLVGEDAERHTNNEIIPTPCRSSNPLAFTTLQIKVVAKPAEKSRNSPAL